MKKGGSPGIIREALASKKWRVELVDQESGKPTGATVEVKSQSLRHPKENEFPGIEGNENQEEKEQESEEAVSRNLDQEATVDPSIHSGGQTSATGGNGGDDAESDEEEEDPDDTAVEDIAHVIGPSTEEEQNLTSSREEE